MPPSPGRRPPSPPGAPSLPADRARLLRRLATLVEENHEALSRLESANAGKPISGARGEIGMVAQVFHFYAGRGRQALRRDDPGRRRRGRHLPRAARCRRPDHAVELPAQHRELEDRPRARDRQHDRDQACRADAADDAPARRARPRGGDPRGRPERRRRQGLRRRPASRRASRRGEDRVHRLDRGRAARDAGRRRDDQARHARARRQVRQRDLRRRRSREGSRVRAVLRLRQRRPGLLCPVTHPRRALGLRPVPRAARRSDPRRQGRRPGRRGDRDGPADLGRASRHRRLVRRGRAAVPRRRSRRGPASGSRARSSRPRTTTASRARRCSARSRR